MLEIAPRERYPRIGVGVASYGDHDALAATMEALRALGEQIHDVVVVEPLDRPTPESSARHVDGARVIGVRRYENAHKTIALDLKPRVDLIVLLREGIVVDAELVNDVRRAFAERPDLAAYILRSARTLMRRGGDGSAERSGRSAFEDGRRSRWAPRYLAPSILCVAARSAAADAFETFARRSDWASYRIYADNVVTRGRFASERPSEHFHALADRPGRTPPGEDGRRTCNDLNRLADAHACYRTFVKRDLRRVVLEQIVSILQGSDVSRRMSFLKGVASEARAYALLRKRLRRDIAALG